MPRLPVLRGAFPDRRKFLVALRVADLPFRFKFGFLRGLRLAQLAALTEILIPQIVKIRRGLVVYDPARRSDLLPDEAAQGAAFALLNSVEHGAALRR